MRRSTSARAAIEPLMYANHAAKSAIDMALMDLIGKLRFDPDLIRATVSRRKGHARILCHAMGLRRSVLLKR